MVWKHSNKAVTRKPPRFIRTLLFCSGSGFMYIDISLVTQTHSSHTGLANTCSLETGVVGWRLAPLRHEAITLNLILKKRRTGPIWHTHPPHFRTWCAKTGFPCHLWISVLWTAYSGCQQCIWGFYEGIELNFKRWGVGLMTLSDACEEWGDETISISTLFADKFWRHKNRPSAIKSTAAYSKIVTTCNCHCNELSRWTTKRSGLRTVLIWSLTRR